MVNSSIGKILIVDDEVELKNILVEALTSQGYEAAGFTSGAAALTALRGQVFDVLLTDLMMPGMDGITLVREGLKIDPHLVCMMMTGQGTIQTAVDAMKEGAFDYVLKPFRLQTVLPVLTRAMNTRHMRLENLQLRETVAIYELGQTIAFTLDPQTVISKLADAALQQTDADEVSVLLPVRDGSDELYVAAVRGENRERLLGERVPLGESISGWVAREREPLILNGEINDARFRSLYTQPQICSAISIPMQVAGKLVGIININALNRPRPFTLGQMKALTILAGTAAAALESASLYTQARTAEKNYRSIFDNAAEGIFRATPDAVRFVSVNPFMARMFGYESPAEMVETVVDMTEQLGLDPTRRDEALELLKKHGVVGNFETRVRRKDGSEIWTSESVRAIEGDNGEIAYLDGIVQDITERKRVQEALQASEAEMRALFASMTDVIIGFDADGRHLKIAPTKTPHLYTPADQRIGKTIHEIFPKEKADFLLAQIRIALEKGRTHRVEYNLAIDGKESWYDGSISPMTEKSVIWVARDITERKQAEQERASLSAEIENQRRRLDNIISSVPGVVWEAWGEPDAATQRTDFVSDFVETMLGYSVEEWLATPNFWLSIVHPDDREAAAQEASAGFASGTSSTMEFRWLAKDGRAIWVGSSWVVIKDDEGRPIGLRGVNTDISERKRAEEELRFQKTLLESQSEASIDGILVISSDRKILSFNQRFVELWGVSEAALGSGSDEQALQSVLDKLADPGEFVKGIEYLYNHPEKTSRNEIELKDGRSFDRHSAPIKSAEGEYYGRVWFFRDITENKRAEGALRESEERYRDLVENAQDIIYSHDLKGNYTSSNKAGEEITGYSLEESLRLNLAETIAPEYITKAREMLTRKLAGENVTAYELELIAKDGHRVPVEVNTRLVMNDGVPVGVTGIARDITERKRAEAELRRLAAAVEETADSIVITDKEGSIQYVNPAFERVTGYAKDEVLNQNPRFLKSGKTDPSVYKELWETITRGEVWSGHLTNRRKDGTLFEERVTISAIYDESREIVNYVAVKQDISDLIQLEEQLRQSQKMEAIGQLAGGVAHDFNNLLTAINGYSALALQRLEDGHPIRPYLEEVKKAGDRAANLTRQLLAFGRKQILQPRALDLNDVVSDMNKLLRRLISEDVQLTAKLSLNLGRVMADPGQIEQVLVNLVVNARDAMPRGGKLTIETGNVELDEAYGSKHVGVAPGDYVVLAVSDTGEGMTDEVSRRIFEPFFTTKEKGKGTGLGLSTVYGIVKQSGGNLSVYSELAKGTTFKVYLPQAVGKTPEAGEKVLEVPPRGGTETILLVEDEEVVRGLARRILEQAGYSVIEAGKGADAIRLCEEHATVDLLLTDVVMPEMSGKELADLLRGQRSDLKILFMSGYTDEAIVHHGVLDSTVEFVQKPFTPAALIKKVREVLDSEVVLSR